MKASIYKKLREQLDQYSVGFPATQSGIEIKILKRLFSEEEAGMYLDMSMMLETPEVIAARTGRNPEAVSSLLAAMAGKGLLFRQRKNEEVKYAAAAFVIGSYEFQLKNMDRDLAEMIEAYFQEGFMDFTPGKNIPPLAAYSGAAVHPGFLAGGALRASPRNHQDQRENRLGRLHLPYPAGNDRQRLRQTHGSMPVVRRACGLLCRKQIWPVYQPRGSSGGFGGQREGGPGESTGQYGQSRGHVQLLR